MWFFLIPLYLAAVTASSLGFLVQDKATCPPKEDLKPCTCSDSGVVTVTCTDINDAAALQSVFTKNNKWKLKIVHFDRCVIDFIPKAIIELESLVTLNISTSKMTALFPKPAEHTPEFDIYLYDVKLLRGFQFELLKKSSMTGLGTFNVDVKTIGKDFKTFMPSSTKSIWLDNARTKHVVKGAFEGLGELELLSLTGGTLRTLDRDWFPRPCKIRFMNFSNQKISLLPENFFEDMPELVLFDAIRNNIKTVDIKVFTKTETAYHLQKNPIVCDCAVKWITTSGKSDGKIFYGTCEESLPGKKLNRLTEKDFSHCQ